MKTMAYRKGITLTGADERTPIGDLYALSTRPGVEIGLLLTDSPDGRNRYPSRYWLEKAVGILGSRCAVHVCGTRACSLVLAGLLPWVAKAGRVQINGPLTEDLLARALEVLTVPVITQHGNPWNNPLARLSFIGHEILVDASGGRGISPDAWIRPDAPEAKPVGFAGGLGPDNLASELPRIAAIAGLGKWWVDMEGKLRDSDDWFSLDKAHACVDILHAWSRASRRAAS